MAASFSAKLSLRQGLRITNHRLFHTTHRRDVVKPFLLADIGEGTRECQIIQWFVQPGARVEQFDKLCEVQSDKTASDVGCSRIFPPDHMD
jgi:2-oxoisovalerate dehydrogenase E2 component (dihydrolipoyl transacylase)